MSPSHDGHSTAVTQPEGSRASSARSDEPHKIETSDRERIQAETFIFVRPPPSLNSHPRNLQIQLFIPHGRTTCKPASSEGSRADTPASGMAAVATATVSGTTVTPSNSNGLVRSPSVVSNRSANSTTSSGGTGAASGRRIAPLYNLNVHSVLMPTTITDAGTDAKVAKVLKRGIELIGFASLEATELSAEGDRLAPETSPPPVVESPCIHGEGRSPEKTSIVDRLKRFAVQRPKFNSSPASTADVPSSSRELNGLGMFKFNDADSPSVQVDGTTSPALRHRAWGYVWSIVRFSRSDLSSHETQVTFEWQKRSAKRQRSSFGDNGMSPVRSPMSALKRGSMDAAVSSTDHLPSAGLRTPDSDASPMLSQTASFDAAVAEMSDEDSDPEQSETPWTCFVQIGDKKTRLALLTPAPFHPKVVAQMQVPGNLAPIEVAKGLLLSVEELKDIVSCTGLWLIVRECLGGIAKRRKGDSNWKLEAKHLVSR